VKGAYLVSVRSAEENDFVGTLAPGLRVWLGACDGEPVHSPVLGEYTSWESGEPFDYSNWNSGEPNAYCWDCQDPVDCCDHCATRGADSYWNDRTESDVYAYVCDRSPPGW
jgi:hypothetical protein